MLLLHVGIWAKKIFVWFSSNLPSVFASETTLCLIFHQKQRFA